MGSSAAGTGNFQVDYYYGATCTGAIATTMPVAWTTTPQCIPYTVGWGAAAGAKFAVSGCAGNTVTGVGWCTVACGACTGFGTIATGTCYPIWAGAYSYKIRALSCNGVASGAQQYSTPSVVAALSAPVMAAIGNMEL